jgi:hypothetical protein
MGYVTRRPVRLYERMNAPLDVMSARPKGILGDHVRSRSRDPDAGLPLVG